MLGLSAALPELRQNRYWLIAALAGGFGELAWMLRLSGLPRAVAFVMWETLVAGAICYLIGQIAYQRRANGKSRRDAHPGNAPLDGAGSVPRAQRRG